MATLNLTTRWVMEGTFLDPGDHTTTQERIGEVMATVLANGTGSGQANELFHDISSPAASADSLDLFGALTNRFGDTIQFIKLKGLIVRNQSTTTGEILTLSGSALTNILGGTSPTYKLGPSGLFVATSPLDGFTITDTSADILSIDPGSDTITYDIWMFGTT